MVQITPSGITYCNPAPVSFCPFVHKQINRRTILLLIMIITKPVIRRLYGNIRKIKLLQRRNQLICFHQPAAMHSGEQLLFFLLIRTIAESCRIAFQKKYRNPHHLQFTGRPGKGLCHIFHVRDDQYPVFLRIHPQHSLFQDCFIAVPVCKNILGYQIIIHLGIGKQMGRFMGKHTFSRPFPLPVIQNGDFRHMPSMGNQFTDPVGIGHQASEMAVLGIISMGIKMGRAVRIRKGHRRKCMRYIMVNPSDQKMIHQVFFQAHSFRPAICPEYLTHGIPFFQRLNRSGRTPQLPKHVMIELPDPFRENAVIIIQILSLGKHLTANIVNARHILS